MILIPLAVALGILGFLILPVVGLVFSVPLFLLAFMFIAAPESKVCIVALGTGNIEATISAGHTAMSPVLSSDGKTLYVCNRFSSDISIIDLKAKKEISRIPVLREPVSAALTKDGKFLLVARVEGADQVVSGTAVEDVVTGAAVELVVAVVAVRCKVRGAWLGMAL